MSHIAFETHSHLKMVHLSINGFQPSLIIETELRSALAARKTFFTVDTLTIQRRRKSSEVSLNNAAPKTGL